MANKKLPSQAWLEEHAEWSTAEWRKGRPMMRVPTVETTPEVGDSICFTIGDESVTGHITKVDAENIYMRCGVVTIVAPITEATIHYHGTPTWEWMV